MIFLDPYHQISFFPDRVTGHKAQETSVTDHEEDRIWITGLATQEMESFCKLYSAKLLTGIFFVFEHLPFPIWLCPILNIIIIYGEKRGLRYFSLWYQVKNVNES